MSKAKLETVKDSVNSNLFPEIKESILERLDDYEDYSEIKDEDDSIIFEVEGCLDLYVKLTGQSAFTPEGQEKDDVEDTVKNYFKTTLPNFKWNIMTEDFIKIYSKKV